MPGKWRKLMNVTIRSKMIILIIVAASSILYVGYTGYDSSRSALFNFKLTADEKIPSITAIMNYSTRLVCLSKKANEIVANYGDTSTLEVDFNDVRSAFLTSYEVLRKIKFNAQIKMRIEAAGEKNKIFVNCADTMVEKHKFRKKFMTKENGILTPLNAFLTAREFEHVSWADQLEKNISAGDEFRGQVDHAICMFGRWIENNGSDDAELKAIFDKFKEPHKKFHETASKINAAMKEAAGIETAKKIFDSETLPLLKQINHIFDECRFYTVTKYLETTTVIDRNLDKLSALNEELRVEFENINDTIDKEINGFVEKSSIDIDSSAGQIFTIGTGAFLILLALGYTIGKSIISVNKFLIEESKKLTRSVQEGDLDARGDAGKTNFEFRGVIEGINGIMDSLIKPLNLTAEYVDRISKGDIPEKITDEYKGDFKKIINNLNQCINAVKGLITDTNSLAASAKAGKLADRADASRHQGDFKKIVEGFNGTLDAVTGPLSTAAKYVDRISKGDIPEKIKEEYKGDFNELKTNLNRCIDAIDKLVADSSGLAKTAVDGELDGRADLSKHQGDFKKIVKGINDMLDAVIKPIQEAVRCLAEMAEGNLAVEMSGEYKGEHAILKNSLNATINSMNEILGHVYISADQVNTGSRQVSDASQALSQGATESASSLEEISSSMQQINSQIEKTAANSMEADNLASAAKISAEAGSEKMGQMTGAMNEINESASNISKIIKTIDEIAFQTNLLALNASVEAARAGRHGKGFTVVAEEVRSLAQRSAKAAKETAEMIENSMKKAGDGTRIAAETAGSLNEMVVRIKRISDIIGEIAAASKEEALGIHQINQGLGQVDQVTQQNTATAEESAAASQELSAQAVELKGMLEKFRLKNSDGGETVSAYLEDRT